MTRSVAKLDEMVRKAKERSTQVKRNMMEEAQAQRRIEDNKHLHGHVTPWMVDERGNRWRQVGDIDGSFTTVQQQRAPHHNKEVAK